MRGRHSILALAAMAGLGVTVAASSYRHDEIDPFDPDSADPMEPRRKNAGRSFYAPPRDHYTSEKPLTKRQKRRRRHANKDTNHDR